jgi:hypothetical protein
LRRLGCGFYGRRPLAVRPGRILSLSIGLIG